MDLFKALTAAQVVREPFPHIAVERALPAGLCAELARAFPPLSFFGGEQLPDAKKVLRHSAHLAGLSGPLAELVAAHVHPAAFASLLRLLGEDARREHRGLERRYGPLQAVRVGQRHAHSHDTHPALMDASLGILAPARGGPGGERGPHVKGPNKLFEGQLFLRHPEDDAPGGEFEIYQARPGHRPAFGPRHQTAAAGLRVVRSLPYRAGTLVVWLNTARSITRVAPRGRSGWPVRFLSLPVQFPGPLFELPGPSTWGRLLGWLGLAG